jgi:hypothetical protein
MANESPKRPIRRVPVPSTSKKEVPITNSSAKAESKAGQTVLLLFLFLMVSGLVYLAVFEKDLLAGESSPRSGSSGLVSDTTATDSTNSSDEEVSTVIGENTEQNTSNSERTTIPNNTPTVYPAGTRFYLIAGTFIFYPYAEKCRDKMKAEGYQAEIISTGDVRKFHRIYIESSEDVAAMRIRRDELKASKGLDVWVYAE